MGPAWVGSGLVANTCKGESVLWWQNTLAYFSKVPKGQKMFYDIFALGMLFTKLSYE
jgi:hypothetical protein